MQKHIQKSTRGFISENKSYSALESGQPNKLIKEYYLIIHSTFLKDSSIRFLSLIEREAYMNLNIEPVSEFIKQHDCKKISGGMGGADI